MLTIFYSHSARQYGYRVTRKLSTPVESLPLYSTAKAARLAAMLYSKI